MKLDILIFTAHPDDAEISIGGSIAKFTSQGFKVGIVDLTQGEMGTRGTKETRKAEAEKASQILGIHYRNNLNIPDGGVKVKDQYTTLLIEEIRKTEPKIIFAPYFNDRHPDHIGAGLLAKDAYFFSGLQKVETFSNGVKQLPYRPQKLFYYMMTYEFTPSVINDISEFFETKMNSIYAYDTQFHNPKSQEPETFISQPGFLSFIEAKAKHFGFMIGKNYGEPFYCEEAINFDFTNMLK